VTTTEGRERLTSALLSELRQSVRGVISVTLVSSDGLPIDTTLSDGKSAKLGAMVAALLSLSKRAAVELEKGGYKELLINGERGYILIVDAGQNAVLAVSTTAQVNLGLLFLRCKEAGRKLRLE
jgi:uncharacterized protein